MRGGNSELTRRQLLQWTAASASFFSAHQCFGVEEPAAPAAQPPRSTQPLILSLELQSPAPLAGMKQFYCQSLGLALIAEQADRLTVAAGETRLTFVSAEPADRGPFYHFAFNIPENKIVPALAWQKQRSALLPIPARLRDPQFPNEVVNYRHWNAHSVFFLDPAGNVVEYIARHDLTNAAGGDFTPKDILYASEIGLIVDDVLAVAGKLKEVAGLDPYIGSSDLFTAVGDQHGLLLVMKRGRILNFNQASDEKAARVYRTSARVRGSRAMTYHFSGFPYEIQVEA
jgi:catechol 2,3-dioxygenase-like lactoylglutathione lyase family enzyme